MPSNQKKTSQLLLKLSLLMQNHPKYFHTTCKDIKKNLTFARCIENLDLFNAPQGYYTSF